MYSIYIYLEIRCTPSYNWKLCLEDVDSSASISPDCTVTTMSDEVLKHAAEFPEHLKTAKEEDVRMLLTDYQFGYYMQCSFLLSYGLKQHCINDAWWRVWNAKIYMSRSWNVDTRARRSVDVPIEGHIQGGPKNRTVLEVFNSRTCWDRIVFYISNCSVFYPE